jgi:hypothetical protein
MTQAQHDESVTTLILSFARHLAERDGDENGLVAARRRNWIDAQGRPTQDGAELVCALREQGATRSVLRLVF